MLNYIIKRFIYMIPTLLLISLVVFIVIQLPPGDWLTAYVASLRESGDEIDPITVELLRERYGFNQPFFTKYLNWISGVLQGDFGYSFGWRKPVGELIWDRLGLTLVVSVSTLLFTWIVSFAIGLYSATHQYSFGDYLATFLGFIGLATPNFMLALILMYLAYKYFGLSVSGLFSIQYAMAPWSWAKFVDLLKHLWIPIIVIGTAGTASLIRVLRANLLDELGKPYVVTARAKGLSYLRLLFKYPVRIALIPFVSTVGWTFAGLISGSVITGIVLNLPTTGPMLLQALKTQDMYLAGSFLLFLSIITVIGTLVSDLLLAIIDPRIRYE
ncbi:MAG: ABC transporter permease [Halanaerobiales bacterium]|nr:ABC transporter permease [Halanaerobiales bacterium]